MAKWLSSAAVAVAVWCAVWPQPYLAAVGAAAALPVLAAILVAASRGSTGFADARAGVAAVPLFCAGALALRASDIHFVDWRAVAVTGGIAGLVALAIGVLVDRTLVQRPGRAAIAAAVALVYGGALVAIANVQFDASLGQDFQSPVLDKHVSNGRSTRYVVTLGPWGPRSGDTQVTVPARAFDRFFSGGSACVRLHDGAFGIPWFAVAAGICRERH